MNDNDIDFRITAFPKSKLSSKMQANTQTYLYDFNPDKETLVPIQVKREKLKAFCGNSCTTDRYKVSGLGEGYLIKDMQTREVFCPHCGYALFWSMRYEKLEPLMKLHYRPKYQKSPYPDLDNEDFPI